MYSKPQAQKPKKVVLAYSAADYFDHHSWLVKLWLEVIAMIGDVGRRNLSCSQEALVPGILGVHRRPARRVCARLHLADVAGRRVYEQPICFDSMARR